MEVKFELDGYIELSEEPEEKVKEDILEFIKENKDLLEKGAPKEKGSEILSLELNENRLNLRIHGDRFVRPHEGLIRYINPLSDEIGPKHHIGVRSIGFNDYKIKFNKIEQSKVDKIKNEFSEIKEIKEINKKEKDKQLEVSLNKLNETEIKSGVIDRLFKLILEYMEEDEELATKVSKIKPGKVLSESKEKKAKLDEDPTEVAKRKGWVKKFPGKGQWTYLPPFMKLFKAIQRISGNEIPEKLDFSEAMFPKLIPLEVMEKMKYLEGLPEGMYYTCSPERKPDIYELFKKELKIQNSPPIDILKKGLNDPGYVLAPAQCEPFYQLFTHEMMDEENLPIKLFDSSGFTYRWEGGGSKGLDRVNEFQRTELVWIGKPKQVETIAEEIVEAYKKVLDDYLKVEWYIEVGDDPFYLEGRKGEMKDIEYPDIPKYEIRVNMPNGESLSVGSVNIHGTHFVEGFSIRSQSEKPLWTGCAGIGLNRWVLAFLAYNGFDPKDWPRKIKEKTLPLPDVPFTLEWPEKQED
ncbi:MAG: Seryl-tRNA synthetase [Candidatus Methanohalarchaeum thermophilum]|uniref:Serine--tRNA ligase n=1 Tax=Methanohalarchaeum thermophilum TaxID=1903181 RepID=A0A1Q6DV47_METT1|nr:MAG: Seryl-tRNA synthetase [Candidatus Methanohalarchaeum thermophilum]